MRHIDLSRLEFHAVDTDGLVEFTVVAPIPDRVCVHVFGADAQIAIRRYHLTGAAAVASGEGAHELAAQILALRDADPPQA